MRSIVDRRLLLALGALLISASASAADDIRFGNLVISPGWSRATPGGAKVAGGYLKIENTGADADTLKSGTADISGKLEIHEMAVANGVMTMRPLANGLTIPPGQTVTLAPGGYHIMFMDLAQPLKQGANFNVTLEFEKAGRVVVPFSVQSIGANDTHGGRDMKPADPSSHSMEHSKTQKH